MKLYKILSYTCLGLGTISIVSCKKTNLNPYDQIALDQSFETITDAKNWVNGVYSSLRRNSYGIFTYTTDVQADQLNATLSYGNRNGFPYRWEGFLADDYSIRGIWFGYYNAISNINRAIEGFQQIQTVNEQDANQLRVYTGDLYLARAYYYFNLMQRWSKAYNPSTATSDLGVPLVLTFDIEAKPARATAKDVADQILSDLSQAKTLLAGVNGSPESITFNADVVTALSARVNLYLQNWVQAFVDASSLVNSSRYSLINTVEGLKAMWKEDKGSEIIFQCNVLNNQRELPGGGNTNNIYLGYNGQQGFYAPDFIPTKGVVDMYSGEDIRKSVYFLTPTVNINGTVRTDIVVTNKFPGNPAYFTSAFTNYVHRPKLFRIAEMYLIAAEASATVSNPSRNIANALIYLNALRMSRGLLPYAGGGDIEGAVRDERTRELAFEGFRLDDLKRWHLGFTRSNPQNISILVAGQNTYTLGITADADKFTWGIPTNDITTNPNLVGQQNPGW